MLWGAVPEGAAGKAASQQMAPDTMVPHDMGGSCYTTKCSVEAESLICTFE